MSDSKKWDKVGGKTADRLSKMAGQLGTWVLIGNAAGLGIVLTWAKEPQFPRELPAEWAYGIFLGGLVCGFVGQLGMLAVMWVGTMNLRESAAYWEAKQQRDALRKDLVSRKIDIPEEWKAENQAHLEKRRSAQSKNGKRIGLGAILGLFFHSLSTLCLLVGLSLPLFFGIL